MFWDVDFAVASLAIILIIVVFYAGQTKLPIHRYKIFDELLAVALVTLGWDFVASWINDNVLKVPFGLVILSNILYYFLISYRGFVFYKYIVVISGVSRKGRKTLYIWTSLPLIAYIISLVISAANHTIFNLQGSTYSTGWVYDALEFLLFFYVALSVFVVLTHGKNFKKVEYFSVIACNLLIVVGLIARIMNPDKLIFNFFVTLAILVLYFSMQDPLLYLDRRFKFFNSDGLKTLYSECIANGQTVYTYGFSIVSYEEIKSMHGQATMDEALKEIGNLLRRMRKDEFGGDSGIVFFYLNNGYFALLSFSDEKLQTCRDEIVKLFKSPFHCNGNDIILNLHGFFINDEKEIPHSAEEYIDALMGLFAYAAKPDSVDNDEKKAEIFKHISHERDIVNALDRAIRNQSLEVYFQPIFGVKEGRINGAEALSRIIDPELGFIPPGEFIEVAENKGLIDALGDTIIRKTCEFIKNHDVKALGLDYINVNLSPIQFTSGDISKHFTDIVNSYGIPHDFLHVEITEQANVDADLMEIRMDELMKQGFHLALDDFGTGYSNLNRIMNFPFDVIKLDLTIVWGYFREDKKKSALPFLVSAFKDNNYTITAEGVETEEMAKGLAAMGVDCLQGYWFSKAIPPDDFVDYLKKEKNKTEAL